MTTLIFANGDMDGRAGWIEPYLDEAALVIAADGGANHLRAVGRWPDVVIGDMDSFPADVRDEYEAAGCRFIEHPAAKDETDLELALLYAVGEGDAAEAGVARDGAAVEREPILIFAGLGGRLDQIFANVLLLMHPALRGRPIRFVTEHQQIWLVGTDGPDTTEFAGQVGDTVSLIPLGGDVHVAQTSGLKWALEDERLTFGPARGLSNVMVEETASVAVASGHLLVVHTDRNWKR